MMNATNDETVQSIIENKNSVTEMLMSGTPLRLTQKHSIDELLASFDHESDLSVADSQAIGPEEDELSYGGDENNSVQGILDVRDETEMIQQQFNDQNLIVKRIDSFHADVTFPMECDAKEYYEIWHDEELKRIKAPQGVQGKTVRIKMVRLNPKADVIDFALEPEDGISRLERRFRCLDFTYLCGSMNDSFDYSDTEEVKSVDDNNSIIEEHGGISVTPVDSLHVDVTFPLGFKSEFFDITHENETKRIKTPTCVAGESIRIKMVSRSSH